MSMNQTPRSSRTHIAIFGRRNVGKSSVINSLTNQEISLVSKIKGTTTDPVFKSMELLPLGPVVIIDTAGIDDSGELGDLRVSKTYDIINKTDIALIVFDVNQNNFDYENKLIEEIKKRKKPFLMVGNKIDSCINEKDFTNIFENEVFKVSALNKIGFNELKEELGNTLNLEEDKFRIVSDLLLPGDVVVLVTPIDTAAPKGRIILPQQQTVRDILDSDAIAIVTKEHQFKMTLDKLAIKPKLVITDSQVFQKIANETPKDIMLTSFSILFARNKGDLKELVNGAKAIEKLENGDKILVSEGCTHHRQSDDIGTKKIPKWLKEYTGLDFDFKYSSGYSFPKDMDDIKLVIHCGACMLNRTDMIYRINQVKEMNIPIVNYGVLISYMHKIFDRALEPFPDVLSSYLNE